MASPGQIEAAAEAIRETMNNMYGCEPLDLDDRYQIARSALTAAEARRETEQRENCKHPNRTTSGTICSDGSGKSDWFCPACGQSGHDEWPARI
jgi:hypothetical protein